MTMNISNSLRKSNLSLLRRVIAEKSNNTINDTCINSLFYFLVNNELEYKQFYVNRITKPFDFAKTMQGKFYGSEKGAHNVLWCSSNSSLTRYSNIWGSEAGVNFSLNTPEINLTQESDGKSIIYSINIWIPCGEYKFSENVLGIINTYFANDGASREFRVVRRVRQHGQLILGLANMFNVPYTSLPYGDTKAVIDFIEDAGLSYVQFTISNECDQGTVLYKNNSYCITYDSTRYCIRSVEHVV